jgi:hypothetical protein
MTQEEFNKQWKKRGKQIIRLKELEYQLKKLTGKKLEEKKIEYSNLYKSLYLESWGRTK